MKEFSRGMQQTHTKTSDLTTVPKHRLACLALGALQLMLMSAQKLCQCRLVSAPTCAANHTHTVDLWGYKVPKWKEDTASATTKIDLGLSPRPGSQPCLPLSPEPSPMSSFTYLSPPFWTFWFTRKNIKRSLFLFLFFKFHIVWAALGSKWMKTPSPVESTWLTGRFNLYEAHRCLISPAWHIKLVSYISFQCQKYSFPTS